MNSSAVLTLTEPEKQGFRWIPAQPESIPERIVFSEWFGNSHPVEVELGCGKGKFLLARAAANHPINFIGIDWSSKWLGASAQRSAAQGMNHVKWIWGRVAVFLNRIPPKSISVFHIYFPDPWPKRRHEDRRLIRAELLEELHALLISGGKIEIATDFQDYFEAIKRSVGKTQAGWSRLQTRINERIFDPAIKTDYEIKYALSGKPLYYLELVKS